MSERAARVLLLEDDAGDADFVLRILLRSQRPRLEAVRSRASAAAFEALVATGFDLVLFGLPSAPGAEGLARLRSLQLRTGAIPVVVLTAEHDEEFGRQLLEAGAQDWLAKLGLNPGTLARTVRHALERERAFEERRSPERVTPVPPRRSSPPGWFADDVFRQYLDESRRRTPRPSQPPVRASQPPPRPSQPPSRASQPPVARHPPAPFPTPPPPSPGESLAGKYTILRRIAEGGLGQIYEARHDLIGHHVAVKMIRAEFSRDPEISVRFLQEARAASAVGHPGCVKIFDFGVSPDGRAYLVMEYLEGESLEGRIARERRLPRVAAVRLASDILDVLAATHERHIVHRDLKPENIFLQVAPRGEVRVKLLDFGIARLTGDQRPDERLTQPGMVMGTPYYMAPEQASGSMEVDARADLYSVGVVLFEMLTGRVPFEGQGYSEVMLKVISAPFPSLRELDPSLPEGLEEVVRRATAREPSGRFATADEFMSALQPFGD
jgi:DNA-binding NarL/FixJ family response regulator/tRNA A-37 threonylcarbamoyl transferase component Bud32